MIEEQGTDSNKMGADSLAKNTPNAPKLSAQAQKFGMLVKKDFSGCS